MNALAQIQTGVRPGELKPIYGAPARGRSFRTLHNTIKEAAWFDDMASAFAEVEDWRGDEAAPKSVPDKIDFIANRMKEAKAKTEFSREWWLLLSLEARRKELLAYASWVCTS